MIYYSIIPLHHPANQEVIIGTPVLAIVPQKNVNNGYLFTVDSARGEHVRNPKSLTRKQCWVETKGFEYCWAVGSSLC